MLSPIITAALFSVLAVAFGYMSAFGGKTGRLPSKGCMILKEEAPAQFRLTLIAYMAVAVGSFILAVWFGWQSIAS